VAESDHIWEGDTGATLFIDRGGIEAGNRVSWLPGRGVGVGWTSRSDFLTSACIEKPNRSPFLYFEHQISWFVWSFVPGSKINSLIIGIESKINSLIIGLLSFLTWISFLSSSGKQGKNEPLFDFYAYRNTWHRKYSQDNKPVTKNHSLKFNVTKNLFLSNLST
jgi:hypothetical protein